MHRSRLRKLAFLVLALLGAPLAMHVVLHDLQHDHHHETATALAALAELHGDHEHPIVSSPAPQVQRLTPVPLPVAMVPVATPATWAPATTAVRNVISPGALRMDDDVGLQPLLSTFLI